MIYKKEKPKKPGKVWQLVYMVHKNAPKDIKLTGPYVLCKAKKNKLEALLKKDPKSYYLIEPA